MRALWRRLRAVRGECLFIDVVVHREVFAWRHGGREWMGHGRWSLWVERK